MSKEKNYWMFTINLFDKDIPGHHIASDSGDCDGIGKVIEKDGTISVLALAGTDESENLLSLIEDEFCYMSDTDEYIGYDDELTSLASNCKNVFSFLHQLRMRKLIAGWHANYDGYYDISEKVHKM